MINISGIKIDSAVHYAVPPNTLLSPGSFYVIASKPADFYNCLWLNPNGNYKGNLSNDEEYI